MLLAQQLFIRNNGSVCVPLPPFDSVRITRIFHFNILLIFTRAGVHSTKTNRLLRILFDTRPSYTERLHELALPTQRSFEISLPHGTRAQVQLLLPPSWREELRDAAFPVLVEV